MTIPLRCLQIEDSESDAAIVVRLLNKAKFAVQGERVESAVDLRAALFRQPWDVIIADFHLPGFDAYKALSVLKESGLDIPFIGVSGKMGNEIAAEIMKRGAADYITKNNLERLVPAVNRELREAERRRKLKITETALIEERERFWTTLCSIGECVITTDILGTVTLLNPNAEKVTSCSTAEATNRSLTEVFTLVDPHTRKPCPNPVSMALKTGIRQESQYPNLLIDRHGGERLVAHSALPVKDSERNLIGAVLVFRDVPSEEKIDDVLRNSNRLKSIGIVASEIAHEFSNLLSGIWGNVELARQYCHSNTITKAMERLNLAIKILTSAKDLTQQLVTLAQVGKPILKAMAIGPILLQSAKLVLQDSNIDYEVQVPENLGQCCVDEAQLSLVVCNIILNARQAISDSGSICIEAKNLPAGSPQSPDQIPGDLVMVSIRDSGQGIEPGQLPRIFDPFFTTSQTLKDGLGLSSVHEIIRQHGGLVRVESQIGKGTTFFLYLPQHRG